ncbi:MAG: helicase associated domain-containing protein [Kiritimatiellia bacterium]
MNDRWDEMLHALIVFRKKYGHCRVPTSNSRFLKLGRWVAAQRHRRRLGLLSEERIHQLDDLGFDWSPMEEEWERMFEQLLQFRNKYGHCDVPEGWKKNPRLARWVQCQRQRKRLGRLPRARIERLGAVGFSWHARRVPKSKKLQVVQEPKKTLKPELQEKLYWLGNDTYLQYNGVGPQPEWLRKYATEHGGEFPPFIPLPCGKTTFFLGNAFVTSRKVVWSGKGPLPEGVLAYVRQNGALPRYECAGVAFRV